MGQSGEWVSRIRASQVPSFYEADLGESFRQKSRFVWFFQILSNIFPNEKQGMPPFDFVNIRAKNKVSKTAKWPTLLPALEFLELAGPLLYPDVLALPHSPVLWWLVKIVFRHFVKIAVMVMYISVETAFQTHDKRVFRHHVETGEIDTRSRSTVLSVLRLLWSSFPSILGPQCGTDGCPHKSWQMSYYT